MIPAVAERLVPPSVRERKFRAHSFAAQLNPLQRDTLFVWIKTHSTQEVVEKVAAPPPGGFGMTVCPTTIDRLRALLKNTSVIAIAEDALETSADLLDAQPSGSVPALHESLQLMLYSSAVNLASSGAEPKLIDQTLTALTRLEKLRLLTSVAPPIAGSPSTPATRHHIHLTISPAPAGAKLTDAAVIQT